MVAAEAATVLAAELQRSTHAEVLVAAAVAVALRQRQGLATQVAVLVL